MQEVVRRVFNCHFDNEGRFNKSLGKYGFGFWPEKAGLGLEVESLFVLLSCENDWGGCDDDGGGGNDGDD